VLGLVISPRTRSWHLGYERSEAEAPKTLAALLRWRHRGTFLAGWEDVARLATEHVTCGRATPATRRCCAIRSEHVPFSPTGGRERCSYGGDSP
jgi:hypothetical protein